MAAISEPSIPAVTGEITCRMVKVVQDQSATQSREAEASREQSLC